MFSFYIFITAVAHQSVEKNQEYRPVNDSPPQRLNSLFKSYHSQSMNLIQQANLFAFGL